MDIKSFNFVVLYCVIIVSIVLPNKVSFCNFDSFSSSIFKQQIVASITHCVCQSKNAIIAVTRLSRAFYFVKWSGKQILNRYRSVDGISTEKR